MLSQRTRIAVAHLIRIIIMRHCSDITVAFVVCVENVIKIILSVGMTKIIQTKYKMSKQFL